MTALIAKEPIPNYRATNPLTSEYRVYPSKFIFRTSSYKVKPKARVLPKIKRENPFLSLEIEEDKLRLSSQLKSIVAQIEEAKEIVSYENDWDEEGAEATDNVTFKNAATFVVDYATYILQEFEVIIAPPYIDIMRDGSISVHWALENAELLVIFKKENTDLAYFYAEQKNRSIPFKSAVELEQPVDEMIALWMKKHLS